MTDAPPPPSPPSPVPSGDPAETPPERVRVTAEPAPSRPAVAPLVYVAGAIVLAVALFFLWRYPAGSGQAAADRTRIATLQDQVAGLSDRLGKLEARATTDLGPLEARVAALEGRKPPDLAPLEARIGRLESHAPDLGPLETRVSRLEARPVPDVSGLATRVDTLAHDEAAAGAKRDADLTALRGRTDGLATDLGNRIASLDANVAQLARTQGDVAGLTARADRTARVQSATAALEAGKPLGQLPGAPPALARFALAAPPTDASLRLNFATAADAARAASHPTPAGGQGFLSRAWTVAQGSVSVRQGDRVMVGDPVAGVLAHAGDLLDAGDLPGCLRVLDGLQGPAKAAMADWTAQAQSLLDARAALAAMAAG